MELKNNKDYKMSIDKTISIQYPITEPAYTSVYGEGQYIYYEATIFDETGLGRNRVDIYYTLDRSLRKYFLTSFHINGYNELLNAIEQKLEKLKDKINWDKVLSEMEQDVEEAFELARRMLFRHRDDDLVDWYYSSMEEAAEE